MRQTALTLFLCLALFAASALIPTQSVAAEKAPAFELQTQQGQETSLSNLIDGRHLLLVFWTTWCPSCKRTMPELDSLASDYSRSDLALLGINAGWNDSPQRAVQFRKKYDIGFPLAFDKGSRIAKKYRIRGVPTLLLIDPEGRIQFEGYSISDKLLKLLNGIE